MHNKITSLTNPHVKNVVALRDRRDRDRQGLTIVEGEREVARALEARVPFKEKTDVRVVKFLLIHFGILRPKMTM